MVPAGGAAQPHSPGDGYGRRITRRVAWKRLSHGLYLRGRVNSLKAQDVEKIEVDQSYKS